MELEERCNVGLVFVWRKKEECKLREMTKIVIDVMVLKDKIFWRKRQSEAYEHYFEK